jgi:hypothetical protein
MAIFSYASRFERMNFPLTHLHKPEHHRQALKLPQSFHELQIRENEKNGASSDSIPLFFL